MTASDDQHTDQPARGRLGVLITNLGTPEAPERKAVRAYLKEFLADPRVVEIPRLLWWFILNLIILNVRPARSARAYRRIWTEDGSPLQIYTRRQAENLQVALKAQYGDSVVLDYAMRYGKPALAHTVQSMIDRGVDRLLVLPLYPQYSCATTASTFDALAADFSARRALPALRFVSSYHDHPDYIAALADSVRRHREQHGAAEKLLLSYHGEPERYRDRGDPYYQECLQTSRLLMQALGLSESECIICFQSRFGAAEWLKPYTDATLQSLAAEGVSSVQVMCPGFSSDCLETLEEIAMENRDVFLQAGGQCYEFIPCLNDSAIHIAALARIIEQQLEGWQPEHGAQSLSADVVDTR